MSTPLCSHCQATLVYINRATGTMACPDCDRTHESDSNQSRPVPDDRRGRPIDPRFARPQ